MFLRCVTKVRRRFFFPIEKPILSKNDKMATKIKVILKRYVFEFFDPRNEDGQLQID